VQRALSELRTDLDKLTDEEAYGLMAAGSVMTEHELSAEMNDLFAEVKTLADEASWRFTRTIPKLAEPRTADALTPGTVLLFRGPRAWWARRRKARAPDGEAGN
jgi:hypothetical protein